MRDEYDFSDAKRAKDVPHLAKLQKEGANKTRITMMLDNDVLSAFREQASKKGLGYQTLINQTLKEALVHRPLDEAVLREVIREELAHYG